VATSLKALANPGVARVAPELYRLPAVTTKVPLDGRVALQAVRTVAPAPVKPPAPPTRMVPPLFLLMRPPRPTVPRPRPTSTTPAPGGGFTEVRFPLPPGWPNPLALPRWRVIIRSTIDPPRSSWDQEGHLIRVWLTPIDTYYYGVWDVIWTESVNCEGGRWSAPNNQYGDGRSLRIVSWELIGFVPCPGRQPVHPEVLPLVEPERPVPEWIPYLPSWVPAAPETQPAPEPEEPEEPEEEEEPLPVPLPLPPPALPPAVPEVPVEIPSEAETERRLAPVPATVPQIDPQRRAPVPVPQTQPYPWRVVPQRPTVVPLADPLPRLPAPSNPPPNQQPQRQPVPPPTTLVLRSVQLVLPQGQRQQLTPEVQSQPEVYRTTRIRVRTTETEEDEGECCCEELKCLEAWCQFEPWTPAYYEGEWREDGYFAERRYSVLVVPSPIQSLAEYLNDRLSDLKRELCEAIDLLGFIDQQPEPYSDRRKHGRQWKLYWGLRKRGEQSRKVLTLPEVNQSIGFPAEPPPIYDGRTCLHYGLESLAFWGRIWVGRSSADALEAYLRGVYGDLVQFRRSENRNRDYRQGRLIPTRARYWNGTKWLPPRRWQPRHYEQD